MLICPKNKLHNQADNLSLRGAQWKVCQPDHTLIQQISNGYQVDMLPSIVLANRIDVADLADYLRGSLEVPDFNCVDSDELVQRLYTAIQRSEKIGIIGDYDADGLTSAALWIQVLRHFKCSYEVWIPNRSDGYGVSKDALRYMSGRGAHLLLVLDCGTSTAELLESAGIDVCIIDHHPSSTRIPKVVACVNPHRHDVSMTSKQWHSLCAVGLSFLVACKFFKTYGLPFDTNRLLDLVMIGTVGDVMPLHGLNRNFVKVGLTHLQHRPGCMQLLDLLDIREPSATKIAFYLIPCLNAAGRIGDVNDALSLLCTTDLVEAERLAKQLKSANLRRREVESQVLEEAEAQVNADKKVICVCSSKWHPGVVGIVAGRLKEKYNKPTFVFYKHGSVWKGSARSVDGVDLGSYIRAAVEKGLAVLGGGHAAAGGITVDTDTFGDWYDWMERSVPILDCLPVSVAESYVTLGALKRMRTLSVLEPCGAGNPAPSFVVSKVVIKSVSPHKEHLRISIADGALSLTLFAFRALDWLSHLKVGTTADLMVVGQDFTYIKDICIVNS